MSPHPLPDDDNKDDEVLLDELDRRGEEAHEAGAFVAFDEHVEKRADEGSK